MVCNLQMFTTVTFDCSFVWFIMHYWKKAYVDILFNKQKACCYNWHKGFNIVDSRNLEGAEDIMRKCTMNEKLQEFELKSVGRCIVSCSIRHSDSQLVHSNQSVRFYIHRLSVTHVIIQLVIQPTNNVIT